MMASFSEGLLLGEKVGLDPDVIVEVFPWLRPHLFDCIHSGFALNSI